LACRFAPGQPIITESCPGANVIVGTEDTARSAPDGYIIIVVPSGYAVNPSRYRASTRRAIHPKNSRA